MIRARLRGKAGALCQFMLLMEGRSPHVFGMPSSNSPVSFILLWCCLLLLAVIVVLLFRIASKLEHLDSRVGSTKAHAPEIPDPSSAETAPGGAFDTFLAEDSARRDLSKAEQFSAYRKWRKEKGMNWSPVEPTSENPPQTHS